MPFGKAVGAHPRKVGVTMLVAVALAALGATRSVSAAMIDTENPDIKLRWDTQVRYNLSIRAQGRNPVIANTPNFDESDYKFGSGDVVNNRLDLFTEMDFAYKGFTGFRVSGAGWYDNGYQSTQVFTAPGLEDRASYYNNTYSPYTKRY